MTTADTAGQTPATLQETDNDKPKRRRGGPTLAEAKKALAILGIEGSEMLDRVQAQRTLGEWIVEPGVGPILANTTFNTIDRCERASVVCLEIAETKDKTVTPKEKILASQGVFAAARAFGELVKTTLAVAKECGVSAVAKEPKLNPGPNLNQQFVFQSPTTVETKQG
jgi:hypothetical protein